ncbi:manganese and iron superoxide dismutase [Thozetella sp. PMI_491]|nr:manganese and iron superoxide dismutase [Thozetella sp. PMI_491]
MFRPRLRIPRVPRVSAVQPAARRWKHHIPSLNYDIKDGIPRFLSPPAVGIAWSDYMTLMIEKLNNMTAGTQHENKDVKQIVMATAREPLEAALFNHASMAHNNHFFFERLSPAPVPIPAPLKASLERSFGSMETLRQQFIVTAAAMFGPGFVWLVRTREAASGQAETFRILTTYLAGTPYPGAHWRQQPVDMNTVGGVTPEGRAGAERYFDRTANAYSAAGLSAAANEDRAPGGVKLWPVLCLNTWEHVWLRDYGIGQSGMGGKVAYAEAWWNAIDWQVVNDTAKIDRKQMGV